MAQKIERVVKIIPEAKEKKNPLKTAKPLAEALTQNINEVINKADFINLDILFDKEDPSDGEEIYVKEKYPIWLLNLIGNNENVENCS